MQPDVSKKVLVALVCEVAFSTQFLGTKHESTSSYVIFYINAILYCFEKIGGRGLLYWLLVTNKGWWDSASYSI